ncbi:sulfotransferase [Rhodobacteraceae bacterium XHP0102]|nr:sulfotransferase [Rhodobacteraceae bacterium XHP0102]
MSASLFNKAEAFFSSCKRPQAITAYRKVCEADSTSQKLLLTSLRRLLTLDDLTYVREFLDRHHSAYLNKVEVAAEFAHLYQLLGRFRVANDILEELLSYHPDDAQLYRLYFSSFQIKSAQDEHLQRSQNLWHALNDADENKVQLGFAIGNSFFSLEMYDEAFHFIDRANELQSRKFTYDGKLRSEQLKQLVALQDTLSDLEISVKSSKLSPLFVSGVPRSGTTLLDRLLTQKFNVKSGREFSYSFDLIYKDIITQRRNLTSSVAMQKAIRKLSSTYLQLIRRDTGQDEGYVTDKNMQAYLSTGYLLKAFPSSHVVFVDRDPAETALSVYRNGFMTGTHVYSNKWKDIAAQIKLHQSAVSHWCERYPERVRCVKYNDIVERTNEVVRNIAQSCSLKENLYSQTRIDDLVTTISFQQSRATVHKKSLNLWKKCSDHMQEFFDCYGFK